MTHWKRPWGWERLKVGGAGDDRGWGGWMASLTQWTWVWASSRSWWRREAWCAAVRGVAKNRTRLSDWTELNYWARECVVIPLGGCVVCAHLRLTKSSSAWAAPCPVLCTHPRGICTPSLHSLCLSAQLLWSTRFHCICSLRPTLPLPTRGPSPDSHTLTVSSSPFFILQLPFLPPGRCFLWSPRDQGQLGRSEAARGCVCEWAGGHWAWQSWWEACTGGDWACGWKTSVLATKREERLSEYTVVRLHRWEGWAWTAPLVRGCWSPNPL